MTNNYVKDFMKYHKRWSTIQTEVKEIILKYKEKIHFYNPQSIHFDLYNNTISVKIDTGSIPFDLIKELNEYFDKDCKEITVSVGHHIILNWRF